MTRPSTYAWMCDASDPRIVAAMKRTCPTCGTRKGRCIMFGAPLVGGRIVHDTRIPDAVRFVEPDDAELDHLPVEKVRG